VDFVARERVSSRTDRNPRTRWSRYRLLGKR